MERSNFLFGVVSAEKTWITRLVAMKANAPMVGPQRTTELFRVVTRVKNAGARWDGGTSASPIGK